MTTTIQTALMPSVYCTITLFEYLLFGGEMLTDACALKELWEFTIAESMTLSNTAKFYDASMNEQHLEGSIESKETLGITELALVPDIGASYFLSKPIGNFGARLDGAELLICVLAPHFVPSSKLSLLEELLCKVESNDPTYVYALIDKNS